MSWYDNLNKPSWAPDSAIFSVIWPIIYIAYTIFGVCIVLFTSGSTRQLLIGLYVAGWIVNLLWIPLFRNSTSIWSPIWILVLWCIIVALAVVAVRSGGRMAWSAVLLSVYIIWLSIATVLGFAIAKLN
jgi:benzodiazapine receptor